ncbi:MAG TPA: tetratricopeptide repeat protein [Longimicrobiales bacterium]|nr:tetratricopeptide repeat protein [Longimicrobiales bacterium]
MSTQALSPERWARVEEVFGEALDYPTGERDRLIREQLADDPTLVAEVFSLLAAHEDTGGLPASWEEGRFQGRHPERIRNFRIVRPLGEGGMGLVFLAIREADGFEQTVALKVIRTRFVDPLLIRRFEEERRILASLEHPGIARLIDGGVTDDGEPYIAMEYVQGENLLEWADARRLDLRERIRLFVAVCEAVHAAHMRLIVHRDLKPSNIFVTPEGDPKLLDFGVAKSLDWAEGGATTRLWVTPAYASPEQVEGRPLTVASDVYALGVILTELLTGSRPYATKGLPLSEFSRLIRERRPTRPSELAERGISTEPMDPGERERAARLRGVAPAQWVRALKGDLDLIVLTALEKDPERRYGSARRLGDDLRRFLDGRPIEARPPSVAYRARKFLGRHRAASLAVASLVLALCAGVAATVWQAGRADAARLEAEAQANRAGQVMALMTDLFRLGDPTRNMGDTIGVRQVLAEGRSKVERDLANAPLVQAELFLELGRVYRNLGLLEEASELGREAVALQALHQPGSLAHADALAFRAVMARAAGEGSAGIPALTEAMEVRERVLAEPDSVLAEVMVALAWEVRSTGDYARAAELFERAGEIQASLLGTDHPLYAHTMLGLASSFHDQGSFDQAEALFRRVAEAGIDRADPDAASALVSLGMVRRLRQEYADAEGLLRSGREMRHRLFGPEHPDVLEADEEWGQMLGTLGRYAEARSLLESTLERSIQVLGEGHDQTRNAREGLASMEAALGDADRAAARFDTVAEEKWRVRGGDHPGVVYTLIAAGESHLEAGRPELARARLVRAVAMAERLGDGDGLNHARARRAMGALLLVEGDPEEAEASVRGALKQIEGLLRPDHRYVLEARRALARVLLARGDARGALETLQGMPEVEARLWPWPHPLRGETALLQARGLRATGREGEVGARLRDAERHLAGLPPSHRMRRELAALRTSG